MSENKANQNIPEPKESQCKTFMGQSSLINTMFRFYGSEINEYKKRISSVTDMDNQKQ